MIHFICDSTPLNGYWAGFIAVDLTPLIQYMQKIERDKWKHFFVGILMGVVLQALLWFCFPKQLVMGIIIAFLLVVAVGYGFELFSKFTGRGHYDIYDAVASTIGGVLGMALILLFELRLFY